MNKKIFLFSLVAIMGLPSHLLGLERSVNDFPTAARSEYVFACMNANKISPDFIRRCSCAIDKIAKRISYKDYEMAESLVRIQLGNSPRNQAYQGVGLSKKPLEKLYRAMAAAELACF